MLAYQLAQKLDQEEIQGVVGGGIQHTATYPTFRCGYACDVETSWDV